MIDETKIIKKLQTRIDEFIKTHPEKKDCESVQTIREFIQLLENESEAAAGNGWIACTHKMPEVETEVLICAKRKYRDGNIKYITTTAIHEDGAMLENDSSWFWNDLDGEWDEENACMIIPEGWWEDRHYNPDDVYNNIVDDEVIAWMPLPEPCEENVSEKIGVI